MCAGIMEYKTIVIINRNKVVEIKEKNAGGSGNTKLRYVVFLDPYYGGTAVEFKTFRELCDWIKENLI